MNIGGIAQGGIIRQLDRLSESAARTANVGLDSSADAGHSMVEDAMVRIEAPAMVAANMAVIRAQDAATGTLLDIVT